MTDKKWKISEQFPESFSSQFPEYSRSVLQLLYNRGLYSQDEVDEFLYPDYHAHIADPYLFQDMEKTVTRIFDAIDRKEKIYIYGDYDADGISGSVILHTVLTWFNADFDVYIPDRFHEGYGLNEKALSEIIKTNPKLIITVDCGVTDVPEIEFVNKHGIDVIIVDHHIVPLEPPACYAMINQKREGEPYSFKHFCATGLAFKVACALIASSRAKKYNIKEGSEKWMLDVVAIGTVADMVPLMGENRTLVTFGLKVIKKTKRLGLQLLLESQPQRMVLHHAPTHPSDNITARTIAFTIAPRINATSRMAHASTSFELLITQSEEMAKNLIAKVEDLNNGRRKSVEKILNEAEEMIATIVLKKGKAPSILCLWKDDWIPGVAGLVSGRLTEKYGRPSFIFGKSHDYYKGSCRSVGDLNLVELMRLCEKENPNIFRDFGGHNLAGGFAITPENVPTFQLFLEHYGEEELQGKDLRPILHIELETKAEDVSWELFDSLLKFEPFGEGNKKPLFLMRNLLVVSVKLVGKNEDHLKLKLKGVSQNGEIQTFDCIGFGLSHKTQQCETGNSIDVVYELEVNEWNGHRELQLNIKDIYKSE